MSQVFYWSDPHFSHKNIIKHCQRPFVSVGEMNAIMYMNWREVLEDQFRLSRDELPTVWTLGDVCMNSKEAFEWFDMYHLQHFREQNKLVWGNHDEGRARYEPFFGEIYGTHETWREYNVQVYDYANNREWRLLLSHAPQEHLGICHMNLYGHHHNNWMRNPELVPKWIREHPERYLNVSAELVGYRPRTLQDLLDMRNDLKLEML